MITNLWSKNIRFLRLRRKLSQETLAANLKISRSKLNAHENGQTVNPTVQDLVAFSEYFAISIDWLLKHDLSALSEGRMREVEEQKNTYASGTRLRVLATTVDKKNQDYVELVSQKAKAGYAAGYSDPEYIAHLPLFSLPHLPRNRKYRMFPTTGDSMLPVPEGAYIVAEYLEDWNGLSKETPCIVITSEDGILFKMAQLDGGEMNLRSLNAQYAPFRLPVDRICEVWKFVNYMSDEMPREAGTLESLAEMVSELRKEVRQLAKDKDVS